MARQKGEGPAGDGLVDGGWTGSKKWMGDFRGRLEPRRRRFGEGGRIAERSTLYRYRRRVH